MRLTPVPALLALVLATSLPAAEPATPWTGTFPMTLRGEERQFVQINGGSFLQLRDDDLTDADFVAGKDVAILAKFERGDDNLVRLSSHPGLTVHADRALWATRVEGDNCWVLGHFSDGTTLDAVLMLSAPSDHQVVAARLDKVTAGDWKGRLAVATWVRAQAQVKPNREFWLAQADTIVGDTMTQAAAAAEQTKDVALLGQAMDWGMTEMNDPRRSARLASAGWIRTAAGPAAEAIAKRMRKLDYVFQQGEYRPRSEALAMEYDERFTALSWKDADGYYKLGRWCDDQAEVLPMAKDRAWRAYQAGFRADPSHSGIRNELGLTGPVAVSELPKKMAADLHDASTGAIVQAPVGWKQGEAIAGDLAWVDPASETAWITARIIAPAPGEPLDFPPLWQSQVGQLQTRPGYVAQADEALPVADAIARIIRFTVPEGRFVRHGQMTLIQPVHRRYLIRIETGGSEDERDAVDNALRGMLPQLKMPLPAGTVSAAVAPVPVPPPAVAPVPEPEPEPLPEPEVQPEPEPVDP